MQIEAGKFEEAPRIKRDRKVIREAVNNFLNSEQPHLKCTFEDLSESKRFASSLCMYKKRNGLDFSIVRRGNTVYIIRRDKDADTQD